MFKKILLPLDGSDYNKISFNYAKEFAKIYGAEIILLHIIDVRNLEGPFLQDLSSSLGASPYLDYQSKIREILDNRGKIILNEYINLCTKENIPFKAISKIGLVSSEIAEEGILSDIIIMGNRGESAHINSKLFGSTFESVVKITETPMLITAKDFLGFDNILVALNDSVHAYKALQFAVNFSLELDLNIDILIVEENDNMFNKIYTKANEYLKSSKIQKFNFHREKENPNEKIIQYSEKLSSNLIAIGAYGHNKLYEFFLGSTTEYVFRHSKVPVFLIR